MIRTDRKLSVDERREILDGHPDINEFWHKVTQRQLVFQMAHVVGDYVAFAWLCLHDLAHMIQTATVALREAKLDWFENLRHESDDQLLNAAHEARYSFDYCTLCMSAASNHLASAMWHFHVEVNQPLHEKYKTARLVRYCWTDQDVPFSALPILSELLDDENWTSILEYRNNWVHRGMPVIQGEFRFTRREFWQDEDDPAPSSYLMKTKRGDGKVTYDTLNVIPDHEMPTLLQQATCALVKLNEASDRFLETFDAQLLEMGCWTLGEKGMSFTPPNYSRDQS